MVTFAGWRLPERYGGGLIEEHMAVRTRSGIFDVSHMGDIMISGSDALQNLQYIFTNDFSDMEDGQFRYTVMCDETGGILDDMIVYRIWDDRYFIVVNAINREFDFEWIKNNVSGKAELDDMSDETAQFAIQGPDAVDIISRFKESVPEGRNRFNAFFFIEETPCLVSRSGYTGEDGFELLCAVEAADTVWDAILEAGDKSGAKLCGIGARDTLRLEAALPLYGHEMDRSISPFETGLGFTVKMKKNNFIGKAALLAAGKPARKRIGLKVTGRGIARENFDVIKDGNVIGRTTSGTHCPYLGYAAAMALIGVGSADEGDTVFVDIRGRLTEAMVVPLPFYTRSVSR